jgi:formate dehydrogenase subunit gamma
MSAAINQVRIKSIIAEHQPLEGPLLPILHALQHDFGYIPKEAIEPLCQALSLSRADIQGVISFYHTFRQNPGGKHTLQVCRAEACQAMGSRELETQVKALLGIDYHQTTPDQLITLEPVYCLGNCACSPNIRVDNQIYGRVDKQRVSEIVDELQTQPLTLATEISS